MPRIVTNAYVDAVYFMPFTADKSEGVFAKPGTRTMYNDCRREAALEAGADMDLAESLAALKILQKCITNWKGFYNTEGDEIPYRPEVLKDLWENDTAMFSSIFVRHREIARMGELADEKN